MRKSWALLVLPVVIVTGTPARPDPVAMEIAEVHDQLEAMKRHPSLVGGDRIGLPGAQAVSDPEK